MDPQQLLIAINIAILRRQFPAVKIKDQIFEGLKIARQIGIDEAIAKEAGGEPTVAELVSRTEGLVAATTSYQDLASWTVEAGKTGLLTEISMACSNYTKGRFRLMFGDKEQWKDIQLPAGLTMPYLNSPVRGGRTILVQGKSSDGTALNMWGHIAGEERI